MTAPTSLRDTRVKRFSPQGASDSLDATDEFPGACAALINLVPDLSTRNVWTSRPGAQLKVDFSHWPPVANPGIVSVFKVVGNIVYGMCGDLTAGTDKPFAYNLLTNAFITVTMTGPVFPTIIANLNVATRLPTMDLIGVFIIITHPNYTLAANGCKGAINISNSAAPVYTSGDTGGALTFVALGVIPSWVVQFNQRAYYGVNPPTGQPSVVASDVLAPGTITNAGQALTFGNNLRLVIAAPLGLSNQLGGIIQSLMVFQSASNIQQVTGDFAVSNGTWAVNTLNVATGIVAQRAVCSTPQGLAFMSPTGMRIIDPNGTVSDPIGTAGTGIVVPFLALNGNTSAAFIFAMGCDASTIRISMWDTANFFNPVEYWYNINRKCWSGPHSPITSFQIEVWNGAFLIIANPNSTVNEGIYIAPSDPNANTNYTENGGQLVSTMASTLLEDNGMMAESELNELQVVTAAFNTTFTVTLADGDGNSLGVSTLLVNPTGADSGFLPRRFDFPAPVVFNRTAIGIVALAPVKIGDSWMRVGTKGYIKNPG